MPAGSGKTACQEGGKTLSNGIDRDVSEEPNHHQEERAAQVERIGEDFCIRGFGRARLHRNLGGGSR